MPLSKMMLSAILTAALTELDEGEDPEKVRAGLLTVLGGIQPPQPRVDRTPVVPGEFGGEPVNVRIPQGGHSVRPSDIPGPGEPPIGGGHILTGSDDPADQRMAAASQKGGDVATMPCAEPGCDRQISSAQNLPYCAAHMPKDNVLKIG